MKKQLTTKKQLHEKKSHDESNDFYIKAGDSLYLHIDVYIKVGSEINISKQEYNKLKPLLTANALTTFRDYIKELKNSKTN